MRAEVEARFPDEYAAWEADPSLSAPQGGESAQPQLARALPALRAALDRTEGGATAGGLA